MGCCGSRATYQEGPEGYLESDGERYSVDALLWIANQKPTTWLPVSDLTWNLTYNLDKARVEGADLQFPIVVVPYGDKLLVADGAHRLQKAVNQHKKRIRVRRLTAREFISTRIV